MDWTGGVPRKTGPARLGHNPSWVKAVDYDAIVSDYDSFREHHRATEESLDAVRQENARLTAGMAKYRD